MEDRTIRLAGGRAVGFADYGVQGATAVLWCHGGPGSRLEPSYLRRQAAEAGLRIIGIDRERHLRRAAFCQPAEVAGGLKA